MSLTEYDKLKKGLYYLATDYELSCLRINASRKLKEYNATDELETEKRQKILKELFGKVGKNVYITPPFFCDYGCHLEIEDDVYMNTGCTILDCTTVRIGKGALLGPNVQIYAVNHPLESELRKTGVEKSTPVIIDENVWIGGGSIILAGITIGKNSVVGAGSVVTKDVPEGVLVAGNPAKIIKKIV